MKSPNKNWNWLIALLVASFGIAFNYKLAGYFNDSNFIDTAPFFLIALIIAVKARNKRASVLNCLAEAILLCGLCATILYDSWLSEQINLAKNAWTGAALSAGFGFMASILAVLLGAFIFESLLRGLRDLYNIIQRRLEKRL